MHPCFRHNRWLRRAVKLATASQQIDKGKQNASCDPEDSDRVCTCIILPPRTDNEEVTPMVEAVSTSAESCIDHAAMIAASTVGR